MPASPEIGLRQRRWVALAITAVALVMARPAVAQAPLRLTDADLPLLREYLAMDAAAAERATRRSEHGEAASQRERAAFEADREERRRKIRTGELDQLALLRESGATGFLVPDGTTYDAACSRRHDVNPGYTVFKGPPTGGGDAARAQVDAWVRWYASKGYNSAEAYTPGVILIGPANRQRGPREVGISLTIRDENCGDDEPRVHVDGPYGESDRQAAFLRRHAEQVDAADSIPALPSAGEAIAAQGGDSAAYIARREALTSAYLTRNYTELEWRISAEGESAAVQAELAARRANVAWLLDAGKDLLPLLRRYLGS